MQTKYFIIFLLLANGVLVHQVLLPIYSGVGSAIYSSPGKGVAQLKEDIKSYEASISKADEIISEAGKLKQKYQAVTQEDIELMKAMVPEDINEVKLHSEMASILRQNGFSSEKLGVSKKTSASSVPGVQAYLVSFPLEDTSYERLKAFLNVIERSRRIVAIKSIDVTPAGEVGGSYKFDIGAETYYIPK
ncbi:MAG: hypothetical protein QG653_400 [Patescibacteria group bacterium]|nr:hypothetical protein [Patescibacteria group bacterium]